MSKSRYGNDRDWEDEYYGEIREVQGDRERIRQRRKEKNRRKDRSFQGESNDDMIVERKWR